MGKTPYHTIVDLLGAGVLNVAEEPPKNVRDLESAPAYTVPLIAEDYPAKTAIMWNAAYEKFGMPDRNVMMVANPDDAGRILDVLRRDPKYRGGGAGIGFKEKVFPLLDEVVSPLARAMEAVNIIKKTADGRLLGDNTDGPGYAASLEEKFQSRGETLAGKKVLLLGAGGAAKAIAFALADRGAVLRILNRTPEKALDSAGAVNAYFQQHIASGGGRSEIAQYLAEQDAVVAAIEDRTRPLWRCSALAAIPETITDEGVEENLRANERILRAYAKPTFIVSDVQIRKEPTATIREAARLGFETLDGIPMVINQGVDAFWWLYGEGLARQGRTKDEVLAIMKDVAK